MGELLDAVITAHGGLDRWNAVRSVDVTFNFSGGLLDLKGFPGHHRPTASVDVKQPRAWSYSGLAVIRTIAGFSLRT